MKSIAKRFVKNESGATAIEYGLIAGFIAVAIIAGLQVIKPSLSTIFGTVGSQLSSAAGTGSGTGTPAAE